MSSIGDTSDFDPYDGAMFVDGRCEAVFARLRECEGLHIDSNGPVPIYSLVRYTDVERAYKEPAVFSPCAGLTLDAFDPREYDSPSRMLEMAPPERHGPLRSAMQGAFRGEVLARVRSRTETRLDRFLAATEENEVIDFVEGFARGAATMMMCELLGVAGEEANRLTPALSAIGEIDFGASPESVSKRRKTELWLLRELTRLVRSREAEERPEGEGLIGILMDTEVEAEPLTDQEVALNCFNVAVAGTGASQHALAGAAALWAGHWEKLEEASSEAKLRRAFVEETLRWLTPLLHLTRIVTEDVEVCGQPIPKGAGVCLWNVSANRDEDVFEDAASFKPDRPPGRNLAFGAGPQYCLGAEVVRAQLDALVIGLVGHRARLDLAGAPTLMPSNAIAGVEALPLRLRPAGS